MSYQSGATQTWNRSTPNDGLLLNAEFNQIYENIDIYIVGNSGSAPPETMTELYNNKIPLSYLDVDGTLSANSDTKIASQKATKTYADTKVSQTFLLNSYGLSGASLNLSTNDISDYTNKRYVTDVEKTVLSNTTGTNTGNETVTTIGTLFNASSQKLAIVDADVFAFADSEDTYMLKKTPWSNIKNVLKTYFDPFYSIDITEGFVTLSGAAQEITSQKTFSNPTYSALFTGGHVGFGTITPDNAMVEISTSDLPSLLERTSAYTNAPITINTLRHKTSSDMVDGFGTNLIFQFQDSSTINHDVGKFNISRYGTDNTSKMTLSVYNAGVAIPGLTIYPSGEISIDTGNLVINNGIISTEEKDIAIGYETLYSNATSGNRNIAIGDFALRNHADVISEIAIGSYALYQNISGENNLAIGHNALENNLIGCYNTAIGFEAGYTGTNFNQTTFIGYCAGYYITCSTNTAIGAYSQTGTVGQHGGTCNTSIGINSLRCNSTGCENVAIGADAILINTGGQGNTAIGFSPLKNNSTGSYNIAIGYNTSLNNYSGNNNIALGYEALCSLGAGDNNIAIGQGALQTNLGGACNIAIGYEAGYNIQGGICNIAIGNQALKANIGNDNIAIGECAIWSNISGTRNVGIGQCVMSGPENTNDNVAIGYNTLQYVNTGACNTSIGSYANRFLVNGSYNVAIGYRASYYPSLENNISIGAFALEGIETYNGGSDNIAIGTCSMQYNKEGICNIAVGHGAFLSGEGNNNISVGYEAFKNGIGCDNIAIGNGALQNDYGNSIIAIGHNAAANLSTGSYTTAIGYEALTNTTTGSFNTSVGYASLKYNETGRYNVALGTYASEQATACYNVAIGVYALRCNISGQQNIGIGYGAGYCRYSGNRNIAIGYNALCGCSIDPPVNNIGASNIAIGHLASRDVASGEYNISLGQDSLLKTNTGCNNIGIGYRAGCVLTTGSHNTLLGYCSNIDAVGASFRTVLGACAIGANDNTVRAGRLSTDTLRGYNYTADSDRRLKEDIKPLELGLDFINTLNPVTYKWKDRQFKDGQCVIYKRNHAGFIAQEVGQALKKAKTDIGLYQDGGFNEGVKREIQIDFDSFVPPRDLKGYSPEQLLAISVKAIQELSVKVDVIEKKLNKK